MQFTVTDKPWSVILPILPFDVFKTDVIYVNVHRHWKWTGTFNVSRVLFNVLRLRHVQSFSSLALAEFWTTYVTVSLVCLAGNHYNDTLNQFAVTEKHMQRHFTNFTVLCLQKYCYLQRHSRTSLVLFCWIFLDLGTLNVSPVFPMVDFQDYRPIFICRLQPSNSRFILI